jgi:DNA polymerase
MMTTDGRNTDELTTDELAAALYFYAEAGVDSVLGEHPVDRFAETRDAKATAVVKKPAQRIQQPGTNVQTKTNTVPAEPLSDRSAGTGPATVPDETAIESAREAAREAVSIDALREALASFNGCNLRFGARNTVFADGNPKADIMFIGEAPGRDEDRQGLPFVGRAGQLLDKMLQAIGLDRTSSYITNMIPWRPPGNRTPTPLEIELCRPFIERHVALANPRIVVLMGNVSTKSLLGTNRGILSIRGTWSTYHPNSDTEIPAMPTLHPAYLLRNPAQKRLSWQDFLSVRARLDAAVDESE